MKRTLVVIDQTSYADALLREAGEMVADTDASLVVLGLQSEDAHSELKAAVAASGGNTNAYGIGQVLDDAEQMAADAAREHLGDDVDYEAEGKIGQDAETVLQAAAEYDCDHIFVRGANRSPAGKALFGDVAQQVLLDFEGPVTVLTP